MAYWLFAAVVGLLAAMSCSLWLMWREEREQSETDIIFNLARRFEDIDLQKDFPNLVRSATTELPGVRRALLADVARKYGRTVEEIEAALLSDTGTNSIDAAMKASTGSSSVEDALLAMLTATRNPFRLRVRHWVLQSREQPLLRIVESALLVMAFVLVLAAIALIALGLRSAWSR